MSLSTVAQPLSQTGTLPVNIASSLVSDLNEKQYCDFCCKPLTTAFLVQCGHCFCGQCVIAIAQQDDFEVCPDTLRAAAMAASEGRPTVLKYAELQTGHDKAKTVQQAESDQQKEDQQHQESYDYPRVCCPMCLRPMEELSVLDPQLRARGGLCEECKQAPRKVRCAQCCHEYCESCDQQIHRFTTTKDHQRSQLAEPGNADGAPIQLPCQAPCHASVLQKALLQSASVPQGSRWLDTSVQRPAEFMCLESGELICAGCEASEFYRGRNVQRIPQAVEQRARTLRTETDKCRALAFELRELTRRYGECDALDTELHQLALHELQMSQEAARKLIDDRFNALRQATADILSIRKQKSNGGREEVHELAKNMMDAVSSAEKRMVGRQPAVFLGEFPTLLERIRNEYAKVLTKIERLPEPKKLAFPKLRGFTELQKAAAELKLDETQKMVEKVGYITRNGVQCKECGTVLLPGARTLREVARKQKGCLYGVSPEVLAADAVRLDPLKGAPGSRHVLCGSCSREIGRWSEADAAEKKFTPGFVFLSTNAVK